jgi:hypothetical protein
MISFKVLKLKKNKMTLDAGFWILDSSTAPRIQHQNIFPGFNIPWGSNAFLIPRITVRLASRMAIDM